MLLYSYIKLNQIFLFLFFYIFHIKNVFLKYLIYYFFVFIFLIFTNMGNEQKNLYDISTILEVYENLEEKKWIEELLDNVKLKIFNNEINDENIEEFKSIVRKITSGYYSMKDKFSEVYRDEWTRYFEHLRAVANIVLDLPNPSVEKVLIALFHDSIEDIWASFENIEFISGDSKIALAVEALSKRPWEDYSDDKVEWKKFRNEEYFVHMESFDSMKFYVDELIETHKLELSEKEIEEVIQNIFDVKFADRIHNLSTQWDINNLDKVKRKVEETKEYFLNSAKELNPVAYKKLKSLILELEIKLADVQKQVKNII